MTLIEDAAAACALADPLADTWLEMSVYNPDEFDTQEMDIPVVLPSGPGDGETDRAAPWQRAWGVGPKEWNRRHKNARVRCPAPTFAPYPPGWLTTAQWDALDAIRAADPTADWNPHSNLVRVRVPLAELLARAPLAARCRVVTARDAAGGCWVSLATPELEG